MERNAGSQAGPGRGGMSGMPGWLCPKRSLCWHSGRIPIHSIPCVWDRWSRDTNQSWTKAPVPNNPRSRGLQNIRTWIPYSCCLPKEIPPNQIHQRTKAQRIKLGVFFLKLNWALPRQPRVVPCPGKDTGKVLGDTAATSVSPPGDPSPHPAPQLQARHSFALRIPWIFLLLTGLKW